MDKDKYILNLCSGKGKFKINKLLFPFKFVLQAVCMCVFLKRSRSSISRIYYLRFSFFVETFQYVGWGHDTTVVRSWHKTSGFLRRSFISSRLESGHNQVSSQAARTQPRSQPSSMNFQEAGEGLTNATTQKLRESNFTTSWHQNMHFLPTCQLEFINWRLNRCLF